MALMFPSDPVHLASTETVHIHRLIKQLPDNFTAWFGLRSAAQHQPHFLLLYKELCGFLIRVSTATQEDAEAALEKADATGELPLGFDEIMILDEFVHDIARTLELPAETRLPIVKLVLFPNVTETTLEPISQRLGSDTDVRYLGLANWNEDRLAEAMTWLSAEPLDPDVVRVARKRIAPEVTIPPEFQPTQLRNRWKSVISPESLMDYTQEAAAKADLDWEPPVDDDKIHARLISGIAGSGKSTVLMGRALVKSELEPEARLLVMTHNRPLLGELRRRFERVAGPNRQVEWHTFLDWSLSFFDPPPTLLTQRERERLAKPLIPEGLHLSIEFILDEVDWIREQRLRRLGAYLIADRSGRAAGLTSKQRETIWDFRDDYQKACDREGLIDASTVLMHFWRLVKSRALKVPQFDAIFIDEAQFFAPAWFDCMKQALTPTGQLFLCADPTQGFLRRRLSWSSAGIEVRGRTTKLRRPYRNGRAILHFADQFYRSRLEDEGVEDLDLPSPETIDTAPEGGTPPRIMLYDNAEDGQSKVLKEVKRLVDRGCAPGQILVLHHHITPLEKLRASINAEFGRGRAVILGDQPVDDRVLVRLCTMETATGLEAPIVFVLGIDELFDREENPAIHEEERELILRDHTRELYMAFTRAGHRLVILLQDPESLRHFEKLDVSLPETRQSVA